MTLSPDGGPALPVKVDTTRTVQGGSAIPVYGYTTAPTDGRPSLAGPALPVRVLTAADLKENGGMWVLEGRPHAMPVYTAPATAQVMGGPALAVYPVNAWPTVPVTPSFAPSDVAGLALWLKADAGLFQDAAKTTPAVADADPVGAWADQSGNGRDAIGQSVGFYPKLKLNIQNGKPVIRITPLQEDVYNLPDLSAVVPTAATVFIVARINATEYGLMGSKNNSSYFRFAGDGNGYLGLFRSVRQDGYPTAMPSTGTNYIFSLVSSATRYDVYVNGTIKAGGTASYGAGTAGQYTLGRSDSGGKLNGDLCEVILYNSALSDDNRASVETYLNSKWAVY